MCDGAEDQVDRASRETVRAELTPGLLLQRASYVRLLQTELAAKRGEIEPLPFGQPTLVVFNVLEQDIDP